jgi:4-hydroxythreonine-4-phosphate dehydrogenase
MTQDSGTVRPRVALTLGEPAGVGPELVARLLADRQSAAAAEIVIVAGRDEIEIARQDSGLEFPVADTPGTGLPLLVDPGHGTGRTFARRRATAEGGQRALANLEAAVGLQQDGRIDALCFAPLNKTSLHLAGMREKDELRWFARRLGFHGTTSELNILEHLWTARVTSHIALKEVSERITAESVAATIVLLAAALREGGFDNPRLAVCALNPHGGEGGAFGREEIDAISPGIALVEQDGFTVSGPYPCDTVFISAHAGQFDGVVTMYHDQGQIAMKLIGFDRGVTVQGGLPLPICTPAHGTAFDIVGRRTANMGAMTNAFQLACQFGAARSAGLVRPERTSSSPPASQPVPSR